MRQTDTTPAVRERAYELWELAGRPDGRGHEFWHQASREIETDLDQERQQSHDDRIVAR